MEVALNESASDKSLSYELNTNIETFGSAERNKKLNNQTQRLSCNQLLREDSDNLSPNWKGVNFETSHASMFEKSLVKSRSHNSNKSLL